MRLAALTSTLALVGAAGCRALTEPDAVDLRFNSYLVVVPAADSVVEAITAVGTTGAIVIVGQLRTGSACYSLAPRVRRDGAFIIAAVDARPAAGECASGQALYGYTLRIGRLPPGDYRLRFVYDVVEATQSSTWAPIDATLHVL